jgi:DNA-binding SARP family transcriptional activator
VKELVKAGGPSLLALLIRADPPHWIAQITKAGLANVPADQRMVIIEAIEQHAAAGTTEVLSSIPYRDFAALRSRLLVREAPRLFLRTLGVLEIHRGSWGSTPVIVRKRRTRALLSLLTAQGTTPCSRDTVLDALWPDADPAAAVNSLNQTLFQLRREIDPEYRDGRSPPYILSGADQLQLHPDLIEVDWLHIVERAGELALGGAAASDFATFVSLVCEGEFLSESRYDDWSTAPRQRIHDQIRDALLVPLQRETLTPRHRAQLARALLNLDPLDESATIAMARAFVDSGRRPAAIALLRRYARLLLTEFDEQPSRELESASQALGIGQLLLDRGGA